VAVLVAVDKTDGMTQRFSEDIDITVFREGIEQPATVEELDSLVLR
jgi:hypothetical protein